MNHDLCRECLRKVKRFGGRPFRAEDVEKALDLRAGYVRNLLSELKRKGWLSSTPDLADARRTIYRLDLAAAGEINFNRLRKS